MSWNVWWGVVEAQRQTTGKGSLQRSCGRVKKMDISRLMKTAPPEYKSEGVGGLETRCDALVY